MSDLERGWWDCPSCRKRTEYVKYPTGSYVCQSCAFEYAYTPIPRPEAT